MWGGKERDGSGIEDRGPDVETRRSMWSFPGMTAGQLRQEPYPNRTTFEESSGVCGTVIPKSTVIVCLDGVHA